MGHLREKHFKYKILKIHSKVLFLYYNYLPLHTNEMEIYGTKLINNGFDSFLTTVPLTLIIKIFIMYSGQVKGGHRF